LTLTESMEFNFATERLREESADLLVPKIKEEQSAHLDHLLSIAPVFYNIRMKLNRDIAVVALQAYQRREDRSLTICEPMCGTGVRGIRMAKEVEGVGKVVMGDINPIAIKLASFNKELNSLGDRVVVRNLEANLLLTLHAAPEKQFDYIDIDPFGTPVYYLDSAVKALRKGGLLAITATDTAPLCGAHPQACLRKYGAIPLHSEYCHEVALRILIGALTSVAIRHEKAAEIIFSHSTDHYVRAYAILEQDSERASENLKEMGYILHCPRCLNRKVAHRLNGLGDGRCEKCGGTMNIAGPLWLGALSEASFCDEMIEEAEEREFKERRLMRLLGAIRSESGYPPTFFSVDVISSLLNLPSSRTDDLLSALRKAGYIVARTHFHPRGIKTDAPIKAMKEILMTISVTRTGA